MTAIVSEPFDYVDTAALEAAWALAGSPPASYNHVTWTGGGGAAVVDINQSYAGKYGFERVFTAADGIVPDTTYLVRITATGTGACTNGVVSAGPDSGHVGSTTFGAPGTRTIEVTATSDASGNLYVFFGFAFTPLGYFDYIANLSVGSLVVDDGVTPPAPETQPPFPTVQAARGIALWSDLACAGGVKLVSLKRGRIQQWKARATLDGNHRLTFGIRLADPVAAEFTELRVLRIEESETVFDEWRIVVVDRTTDPGLVTVQAVSVEQDLGRKTLLAYTDGDGIVRYDIDHVGITPTELLETYALPALVAAGLTWVSLGAITPTQRIDIHLSWESALSLCRRIAEATGTEFQLRRNGNTGYLIDFLTAIGADRDIADFRPRKNLVQLSETRDVTKQATRVYGRGGEVDGVRGTMARAAWKVTAVTGSGPWVATIADWAGGDGPIGFDGQLDGMLMGINGNPDYTVTASSAADQTVTVTGAGLGPAVEDRVVFVNSDGSDVVYLEDPTLVQAPPTGYGVSVGVVDVPDAPAVENGLRNAAMRDWSGADSDPPDHWLVVAGTSPVIERTTDPAYTQFGGQSAKITGTNDGDGIYTQPAELPAFTALHPNVAGYVWVYVVSGQVRVELLGYGPSSEVVLPPAPKVATSDQQGTWLQLGVTTDIVKALGTTLAAVALRVVQHGSTPAVFYVDGGQITHTPSQQPFVEVSGATQLWQAANRALLASAAPVRTYKARILDLARLDPDRWGLDSPVWLGASSRMTDPRLALTFTTRVTELERDYLVPANSDLTLASSNARFTKRTAGTISGVTTVPYSTIPGGSTPDGAAYIPESEKGAASGVAELDGAGLVPLDELPVLDEAHGGTGQTDYDTGDILFASAVDTLARRPIGSEGQVLIVAGGVPVWGTLTGPVGISTGWGTNWDGSWGN